MLWGSSFISQFYLSRKPPLFLIETEANLTVIENSIGALSDKIGRNKAVIFASLWGLLGSSLQVAAQNAPWMLCARILAGVGTGGISAVIPVWGSGKFSFWGGVC